MLTIYCSAFRYQARQNGHTVIDTPAECRSFAEHWSDIMAKRVASLEFAIKSQYLLRTKRPQQLWGYQEILHLSRHFLLFEDPVILRRSDG